VDKDHSNTGGISSSKRLSFALFMNTSFTIIEIVGGLYTNSMAILSDALHDLGDTLALGLAWFLERKSQGGRTNRFSYGYKRFSLLGSATTSLILIVGSIVILYNAIPRLIHPEQTHASGMIGFAIVGVLANGMAYFRLSGGNSLNEKAVKLHLLEDILGWIAVLIGSVVIYFTDWFIIDPILSVGIALYIMRNTFSNFKATINVFLQAVPPDMNMDEVESSLLNVEGIESVHDLHVWSIDGSKNVLTVHLVIPDERDSDRHEIKVRAREAMDGMGIGHCTIEVELKSEPCGMPGHED